MRNVQMLLNAIGYTAPPLPSRTRATVSRLVKLAVILGAFGLFLMFAAYTLWRAWETTIWAAFWFALVFALLIGGIPIIVAPLLRAYAQRTRNTARALLEAAASGDPRLAPLAERQPLPETPNQRSMTLTLGPLKRLDTGTPTSAVALLVPLLLLLVLSITGLSSAMLQNTGNFTPLVLLPLVFLLLLPFTVFLRLAITGRTTMVTVDQQGLTFTRRRFIRQKVRVPGSQIRSFFQVVYQSPPVSTVALPRSERTTYVLDGQSGILLWTISPTSSDEAHEASDLLCRMLTTRTGLPLRDLSGFAADLAQTSGYAPRLIAARIPEGTEGPSGPYIAAIARSAATSKRAQRRSKALAWLAAAVILPLFVVLGAGGGWLEHYQNQYFASLPALIHAKAPLYHDSLVYDDGDWGVRKPTSQDGTSSVFVDDSYQVTGTTNGAVHAWPDKSFKDVAVEVTVRQFGTAPPGGVESVGLVLRAGANPLDMVTFDVDTTGHWALWHDDGRASYTTNYWRLLANGWSPVVHTGIGAENRLLVITRGLLYLCYVNDHFVGSYYDSLQRTYAWGAAGVYVNNGGYTGAFRDFTVYPVTPLTSLSFV